MIRREYFPTCGLSYPISIIFWIVLSDSSLDADSSSEAGISTADGNCSTTTLGCIIGMGEL